MPALAVCLFDFGPVNFALFLLILGHTILRIYYYSSASATAAAAARQ